MQHGDYSQQYCIAYLNVARRVDVKNSPMRKKMCNSVVTDVS